MITLKHLKLLLWAKQRRLDALQARLVQEQAAAQASAAAAAAAEQQAEAHALRLAQGVAQLQGLLDAPALRPEHLVAQQHVQAGLQAQHTAALAALEAARQRCQQALAAVAAAQRALQRAESQRELLQARREQLLQARGAEQEDTQDEESEEAAVARAVGQRQEALRQAHAAATARART